MKKSNKITTQTIKFTRQDLLEYICKKEDFSIENSTIEFHIVASPLSKKKYGENKNVSMITITETIEHEDNL